jgi:hypothetical protein
MAFRADEEIQKGLERALRYLVPTDLCEEKSESKNFINSIIDELGPVIESYPSWHPLMTSHDLGNNGVTSPGEDCGYKGLDHTIYFANGFITCPYNDSQTVIDSVENLVSNSIATITAKRLYIPLYHITAKPILVKCEWHKRLPITNMIPKSIAAPLMLEQELPNWRTAECAETWETMRTNFLGTPNGSKSSLFINKETGQVLKSLWTNVINTGMFGNIRID